MSAVRLPAFISFRSLLAICERISPFSLQGRKGVCSVITPSTFPYIYTLSKKTNLAFARLAASMALRMMRGHSARHSVMSYFRPTSRNAILEPAIALNSVVKVGQIGCDCLRCARNQFGIPGDQADGLVTSDELFDKVAADCAARSEDADHGCMLRGMTESPQEVQLRRRKGSIFQRRRRTGHFHSNHH